MISRIHHSRVKNTVNIFSVDELSKGRRRLIVHPQSFNECFPVEILPKELALHGIGEIIESTTANGVAMLSDFTAWFDHFLLPHGSSEFFCFQFGEQWFQWKTLPTGANVCPALGQLVSWAIVRSALKLSALKPTAVHVFIDNVRAIFTTNSEAHNFSQNFKHVCQEVNAKVNEGEMVVGAIYTFLGVVFQHSSSNLTVQLSEKFVDKLKSQSDNQRVDNQRMTIRELLRFAGKLLHASRVCGTQI